MAKHSIIVKRGLKKTIGREGKLKAVYDYSSGFLNLYYTGTLISQAEAEVGDAIVINNKGINSEMHYTLQNAHPAEILMWLCGFKKEQRTFIPAEYQEVYEDQDRDLPRWNGYEEHVIEGPGYKMVYATRGYYNNVEPRIAFVQDDIWKSSIVEALSKCKRFHFVNYGDEFYLDILKDRLQLTDNDIEKIKKYDYQAF